MTELKLGEGDPKYIKYLLDPKEEYEFYYIVGNREKTAPVERIGVVKKMLIAHSEVFKRELQDSKLRDKNGTEITDIFPSTFRNMLRYVYGYNNTATLSFEDSDDLLYVADKYMMEQLKQLLSSRLMKLLNADNICSLLNNMAVYRVLELNNEVTKIIQFETSKVLASPQFLGLCSDALVKILEQEQLKVPEIELWRSAVKWARGRVNCEDGPTLRQELVKPLQQLRVCTVPLEDFCREVVPTNILNYKEVFDVCMFHGDKNTKPDMKEICNITEPRIAVPQYEKSLLQQVVLPNYHPYSNSRQSVVDISTKGSRLELTSLALYQHNSSQCDISIRIENSTDQSQAPVTVERRNQQASNKVFTVSVSGDEDDEAVHLLPNTRYKLTITSSQPLNVYYNYNYSSYSGTHFDVLYSCNGYYNTCINRIDYKTVTLK